MIVVSNTSPLNYLVLVEAKRFLPDLFGQIVAPAAFVPFGRLGPGESEAIALAKQCNADILLMDERDGSAVARQLGLTVAGTLAVLALAAEKGLLSLPTAIAELRRTTFRAPERLIAEMLRRDRLREL